MKKTNQTRSNINVPIDEILSASRMKHALTPFIKTQAKILKAAETDKALQKVLDFYSEPFARVIEISKLIDPFIITKRMHTLLFPNLPFFFGDLSLERFEELQQLFVQCDAIGLDLSLYENIPIKTFYDLLKDQKPCDYKEVLTEYLKNSQLLDQPETNTITLKSIAKVFVILGTLIEFWIRLSFVFPSLSPQELKDTFQAFATQYIQQEIPECDATVAKDIARYLINGDQDKNSENTDKDDHPTIVINGNVYIINQAPLPQIYSEQKQSDSRKEVSDQGQEIHQNIGVIKQEK